jgi:hypothetical protein
MVCRVLFSLGMLSAVVATAGAQSLRVSPHSLPVPPEVGAPVAAVLAADGLRAEIGQTTVEFWWVKALATGTGHPSSTGGWRQVPEGALVGVLRTSSTLRDIRGKVVKAGVYTLRFAVQPANGDHLGVSPFREFLLVSPAATDQSEAPTGHEGAVNLARQSIGSAHPGVLAIDPPVAEGPAGTLRANDAGHEGVIVEIPVRGGASLRFGMTLVGRIEA